MARILVVTNWYPPHHYGGYELSCYDVVRALTARGHDVHVVCSDHRRQSVAKREPAMVTGPEPERAHEPDHERLVQRELRMYWRDGRPWRPALRARLAIERHNQQVLARAVEQHRPEVVSIWHMGALSLGLLSTLAEATHPLVYSVCDDWLTYGNRLDPWAGLFDGWVWKRALGRLVRPFVGVPTTLGDLGATGAFCFASDVTRRRSEAGGPWVYPRHAIVPLGIERSLYPPTPQAVPERRWRGRVLYTGRFDARKGVDTVLRALPLLPPETTLACYGAATDDERARVTELAERLGVRARVTFGELARDRLAEAYVDADVFVFPSEWPEPFGLVPLEAMACGTPVVATRAGGSAEFLVDGGNCLAFPPGDAGALAAAVRRLQDPAVRARLVAGGYRTADELTSERLAAGTEAWLVAAAAGYPNGPPPPDPLELGLETGPTDPLGRHQAQAPRVVASGDPAAIRALYVGLGDDWWAAQRCGGADPPVLSAPETGPVVIGRLEGTTGLVLDAGCGPKPSVSMALAAHRARTVVSMDIGWGTVRTARTLALADGLDLVAVAGDVEHLPFRSGSFAALVCDDTIEHLSDDHAGAAELARVLRRDGFGVLATPNRQSVAVLRAKLRDRARGIRKPDSAYFCSSSHLREYTWAEFETLVAGAFDVRARAPVGWRDGRKAGLTPALRYGPLRRLSQMIVLEVQPRAAPRRRRVGS